MPILNYTTKVDSYKTIGEIQKILAAAGAKKVIIDNDDENRPAGLSFSLVGSDNIMYLYKLPCNFVGILNAMRNNKKVPRHMCSKDQALRVGWRILKDWVASQTAIVEADLAAMQQIFLPYAVTKDGITLYEYVNDKKNSNLLLQQG